MTIELDRGAVAGSRVVQVAFDGRELTCTDGEAVAPDALAVGSHVSFVRVGDDADASNPPVIAARALRVGC